MTCHRSSVANLLYCDTKIPFLLIPKADPARQGIVPRVLDYDILRTELPISRCHNPTAPCLFRRQGDEHEALTFRLDTLGISTHHAQKFQAAFFASADF